MPEELPEPMVDLDARALRAWVDRADREDPDCGDVVLVISDGDVTVRITSGAGGRMQLAHFGADRLEIAAGQFAAALASRSQSAQARLARPQPPADRGSHGPLNGP